MPAMELVTATGTAIGAAAADLTAAAGNTFTVRNAELASRVRLLQLWADVQVAGTVRIRSPRLHDNVQGIRFDTVVSEVKPLLPWGFAQHLTPQDTLTVQLAGSAVAGDIETVCMLLYYDQLPSINARLATPEEIVGRIRNMVTVENTIATGVAGGYSGEEALTAEFDLLKANTDYAILGYVVDTECAAVRWRGTDTGNLGVGGPGTDDSREITSDWFVRLSRLYNVAAIPVFNAANADNILIDAVQDENGADVTVNTILAELGT